MLVQPMTLDEMVERIKIAKNWRWKYRLDGWKDPHRTFKKISVTEEGAKEIIKSISKEDLSEMRLNTLHPERENLWIFWKPILIKGQLRTLYIKLSSRKPGDIYVHSFHLNEGARSYQAIVNSKRKANSVNVIE